jgi:GTPase
VTREQSKREALARLAAEVRERLAPGDDIELVVVTCSTDGEFVGVASTVSVERTEAILRAAATRDGHADHSGCASESGTI